ncbi:hypothetical protein O1W68_09930 [Rhodococcus sp. H36-A4]|uniref:hypothetical protein n=1 Tax=Rhodococcus sp. H36-A4 TaxID=3004353 RepID=UPI0022B0767F|nr:hypothetical protein [Rhodococcus sp. H36-A4]MCZ4078260.1 hypothetical protein [Rhodococcus sp. H36-A4]
MRLFSRTDSFGGPRGKVARRGVDIAVIVLFGSETGTAEEVADKIAEVMTGARDITALLVP